MKKFALSIIALFAFAVIFTSCEKMDVTHADGSDLSGSVQMTAGSDLSGSVQMSAGSDLSSSVQ